VGVFRQSLRTYFLEVCFVCCTCGELESGTGPPRHTANPPSRVVGTNLNEHQPAVIAARKQDKMSTKKKIPTIIPAVGFRILTCCINQENDRAVFTDSPLIGWLQTNDPTRAPVDPIFLSEDQGPVLGSEMAPYNLVYRVFDSEKHEGQRFIIKNNLEAQARYLESESLKKVKNR
jgi:hypothetical protein